MRNEADKDLAQANTSGWHKSSFSGEADCCVEIRLLGELIQVRDSKEVQAGGASAVLTFTGPEWVAFVAGVKAGEFDC